MKPHPAGPCALRAPSHRQVTPFRLLDGTACGPLSASSVGLSLASLHHGRLGGWLAQITQENKGVNEEIKALEMSFCFAFKLGTLHRPSRKQASAIYTLLSSSQDIKRTKR